MKKDFFRFHRAGPGLVSLSPLKDTGILCNQRTVHTNEQKKLTGRASGERKLKFYLIKEKNIPLGDSLCIIH